MSVVFLIASEWSGIVKKGMAENGYPNCMGPTEGLIERFGEHNFGPAEIQRLVESWDVLQGIAQGTIVREALNQSLSTINPYISEWVRPQRVYPKGWKSTSEDQLAVLRGFYPELDSLHVLRLAQDMRVPLDADGIVVIPKLSRVAEVLGVEDPYGVGYVGLLEVVCGYLAKKHKFYNYRTEQLTPELCQVRTSTAAAIQTLEQEQEGDFLVFPAQMGTRWAGYSPRNSTWQMEYGSTEFPLDVWAGGNILLTNPEGLGRNDHLIIDCPGTEIRFGPGEAFQYCLDFYFNEGRLSLGLRWLFNPLYCTGAASGFVR